MKLTYKGRYRGEEQLPKVQLPEGAVAFREPDNPAQLNLAAMLHLIPAAVVMFAVVVLTLVLREEMYLDSFPWMLFGFLLSLLTILPHELLHGLCFGREAQVELYVSPKDMMAFVVSTQPISKWRFIWMSLCPNLVFGWLPLALWVVLPWKAGASDLLLCFALCSICMGGGDYMNVHHALLQMPKGSIQQLSGFHSYWYMP